MIYLLTPLYRVTYWTWDNDNNKVYHPKLDGVMSGLHARCMQPKTTRSAPDEPGPRTVPFTPPNTKTQIWKVATDRAQTDDPDSRPFHRGHPTLLCGLTSKSNIGSTTNYRALFFQGPASPTNQLPRLSPSRISRKLRGLAA